MFGASVTLERVLISVDQKPAYGAVGFLVDRLGRAGNTFRSGETGKSCIPVMEQAALHQPRRREAPAGLPSRAAAGPARHPHPRLHRQPLSAGTVPAPGTTPGRGTPGRSMIAKTYFNAKRISSYSIQTSSR